METSSNVREFLDILSDNLHDRANMDFEAMARMKAIESPYQEKLMCWDTPYFTHKAKTQLLNAANSDFSPYFSLGGCESWAPDVYKLAVVHQREGLLGHIYCDLYERPGKPHQDCHFTIQGGKLLPDGTYQAGHALHSMLGRAAHQHVAGTRCATDLAELPSVLNEYFASSPEVVRRFARHFQTREAMPEEMLQRLCASKYLFGASEMQLQVFYSVLDQQYHGVNAADVDNTTSVLQETQKQYYGLPYVDNTAWQHRFSHLIGYGAKYYSYLISRALAWSVWRQNFEALNYVIVNNTTKLY
ncbi:unnamed protein product, partial [Leptidea sinapis]